MCFDMRCLFICDIEACRRPHFIGRNGIFQLLTRGFGLVGMDRGLQEMFVAGTKAAVRVQARYLGGGEVLRADVGRGEDVNRMNGAPAMRCSGWCLRSTRIWVGFHGRPAVDFLVAKLEPSAAIETRSAAFNVEVIDRGSLTGVIAAETGLTVTLALAVAASEVLPRTSIPSLKAPPYR